MPELQPDLETLSAASLSEAFPRAVRSGAASAWPVIARSVDRSYKSERFAIRIGDEEILIPSRICFSFSFRDLFPLRGVGGQAASCLRTRSVDGFERQKALRAVAALNLPWSIPFVVALIGEYVIEILDDIYDALPSIDPGLLKTFLTANPGFHRLTRQRVASYWDVYHRRRLGRADYVGFRLLAALDAIMRDKINEPGT